MKFLHHLCTFAGKASSTSSLTHKLASLTLTSSNNKQSDKQEHKRTFSLPGRGAGHKSDKNKHDKSDKNKMSDKQANKDKDPSLTNSGSSADSGLGWVGCPRLNETPMLEPVVVKKVAHER